MTNHGQYEIYLTGSEKYIRRNVYEEDGKYFIKWYGQWIEVKHGTFGYVTVETY